LTWRALKGGGGRPHFELQHHLILLSISQCLLPDRPIATNRLCFQETADFGGLVKHSVEPSEIHHAILDFSLDVDHFVHWLDSSVAS
jgi:hypothetical protein